MKDNDSFRLVDPETAVAAGVILAIGVCVGLSLGGYLEERHGTKPCLEATQALIESVLTEPTYITVAGEPAAACRVLKRKS